MTLTPAYLAEAITDEVALAELLGWTVSGAPVEITPNVTLWGSKGRTFAASSGMSTAPLGPSTFLPKWRRSWAGAGELVVRCEMMIACTQTGVFVNCRADGFHATECHSEHPSKDHAIWAAMCKAAIAYLTAESSTTKV